MSFTKMTRAVLPAALCVLVAACGGGDKPRPIDASAPMLATAAAAGTLTFSGPRSSYSIIPTGLGWFVGNSQNGDMYPSSTTAIQFDDFSVNLVVGTKSLAISDADLKLLCELYVAFFNRVPDADGLAFWIDQMHGGATLPQIADSFYAAAIQYSDLTGYSAGMSNADFVKIIYKNVLGRSTVDDSGLQFWTTALATGQATRGNLIASILGSAHTFKGDATWGWVADLLDNKYAVARYFALEQGLNYNTPSQSITQTMAIAAAVTPTDTSAAIAKIGFTDTYFTTLLARRGERLPDTGIGPDQCVAAGTNALVNCASAAAQALGATSQDGMTGLDVQAPDASDGKLGFSYTKLDANGNALPASATSWECVKDNVTGLTWEVKKTDGSFRDVTAEFYVSGGDDFGNALYTDRLNAIGLCGIASWRLPGADELQGLVDYGSSNSVTNYPGTAAIVSTWMGPAMSGPYWSSWFDHYDDQYSYFTVVDFRDGSTGPGNTYQRTHSIRAVAGTGNNDMNRFTFSAGGAEVIDARTGLTWRRCLEGMAWSGSTCTGSPTLYSYDDALTHAQAQSGWRVPNVKELFSLVQLDPLGATPAKLTGVVDPKVFPNADPQPNTTAEATWTSTPYLWTATNIHEASTAYNVDFKVGDVSPYNFSGRSTPHTLRLVR